MAIIFVKVDNVGELVLVTQNTHSNADDVEVCVDILWRLTHRMCREAEIGWGVL